MKLQTNSIGTIFFDFAKEQKWYIIDENGKAKYISQEIWFHYLKRKFKVNSPLKEISSKFLPFYNQ